MKNKIKSFINKYDKLKQIYNKIFNIYELSNNMKMVEDNLKRADSVIDLGCGSNPCKCATVAVDKYITPEHREYGANKKIDIDSIEKGGVKFIQADIEELPFPDKEFDMAYSHHVIEHVENPAKTCMEMQRIAKKGVIMCPSIFAEGMFGRKYHKWKIISCGNRLIFIEKGMDEPLWFGDGPIVKNGKIVAKKECNPFDILLNEGNWYHGLVRYPYLTKKLRNYWFGHYDIMENVFYWENSFEYTVFWQNGKIETSN